ncbi:uncharacterized protein [Apostichopus japonicus]|uniref:uncharacterized protein isoform X2 n=1 Tax=Stichopus japonicus TaxID=307972 RepID=UPI003AB2C8B4
MWPGKLSVCHHEFLSVPRKFPLSNHWGLSDVPRGKNMSTLQERCKPWLRLKWLVCLVIPYVFVLALLPIEDSKMVHYEMKHDINISKSLTRSVFQTSHRKRKVWTENSTYASIIPFPYFNNHLPNAYLYPTNDTTYKDSVVGYVHSPKSGGTTIKECMISMLAEQKTVPVLMYFKSAAGIRQNLLNQVSTLEKYYMGDSTLGICDYATPQPCTYFTVLREPYDRVISHYYFCKDGGESYPPCNTTLEEFVLNSCSLFFRQTTVRFNCLYDQSNEACSTNSTCSLPWHCNATEVHVDNLEITENQRQAILDYVIGHLDKMFGVIGILEEFETSMKLFQDTFGLPFNDQCSETHHNAGLYTYRERENRTRNKEIEKSKQRLKGNRDVRRCLREDEKIYEKATEIFKLQKEKYEMKLKKETVG